MPRHPPCTLSSLTTFTDHRHESKSEARIQKSEVKTLPTAGHDVRPRPSRGRAGDGTNDRQTDQIQDDPRHDPAHANYSTRTQPLTVALAKKVLDDPLAKTEDQTKPNARRSQFLSRPPHGGSVRVTSQNLLLNLYSLVKELRSGKPLRYKRRRRFEAGDGVFGQ